MILSLDGVTAGVLLTFQRGRRERASTQQLPGLNISVLLCSGGRARSYSPQGHGRSNQRFSSRERKKKTLKIQQPATEGLKTPTLETLCDAFSRKVMDVIAGGFLAGAGASASEADIKNRTSRGFRRFQSAKSVLNLTRHQTLRCLQDNWRNNGGEAVRAMLCASGNKDVGSTQRTLHEVELKLCRHTTVGTQ